MNERIPLRERVQSARLTFRSSRIVYYGPHPCPNCSAQICKMGIEFGANAFDYPYGPIYPNTEWHPHVCDPKRVEQQIKPTEGPQVHPDGIFTEITVNRFCAECRELFGSQHKPSCHRQGVVSTESFDWEGK